MFVFHFRCSSNQAEEDRVADSTGPETQGPDRPAHRHHSDRSGRHQGARCGSTVPASLRGGRPEGSANTTTPISCQGHLRNCETWNSPRSLAQVAGRGESTVQRLGSRIRTRTVSLPGHPLKIQIFQLRFILSSLHFIYCLFSVTRVLSNKDITFSLFYNFTCLLFQSPSRLLRVIRRYSRS